MHNKCPNPSPHFKGHCLTHPVLCLAQMAPHILKQMKKNKSSNKRTQTSTVNFNEQQFRCFNAFLSSVIAVRSYSVMQACSIFLEQHNLETLTWSMSTQTRASNIGCSMRLSGAYYWGSHYSNREQGNKHRWESLLGQLWVTSSVIGGLWWTLGYSHVLACLFSNMTTKIKPIWEAFVMFI